MYINFLFLLLNLTYTFSMEQPAPPINMSLYKIITTIESKDYEITAVFNDDQLNFIPADSKANTHSIVEINKENKDRLLNTIITNFRHFHPNKTPPSELTGYKIVRQTQSLFKNCYAWMTSSCVFSTTNAYIPVVVEKREPQLFNYFVSSDVCRAYLDGLTPREILSLTQVSKSVRSSFMNSLMKNNLLSTKLRNFINIEKSDKSMEFLNREFQLLFSIKLELEKQRDYLEKDIRQDDSYVMKFDRSIQPEWHVRPPSKEEIYYMDKFNRQSKLLKSIKILLGQINQKLKVLYTPLNEIESLKLTDVASIQVQYDNLSSKPTISTWMNDYYHNILHIISQTYDSYNIEGNKGLLKFALILSGYITYKRLQDKGNNK